MTQLKDKFPKEKDKECLNSQKHELLPNGECIHCGYNKSEEKCPKCGSGNTGDFGSERAGYTECQDCGYNWNWWCV